MKEKVILLTLAVLLLAGLCYSYFGLWLGERFYYGIPMNCLSSAGLLDLAFNEDKDVRTEAIFALANIDRKSIYRSGPGTRAANLGSNSTVLIVQRSSSVIPGDERYDLVLLERSGKVLDRLSVTVSNRFADSESFRCDVLGAEQDGAQLVLRNPIPGGRGNFRYSIDISGRTHSFGWGRDSDSGQMPPPELEKLGLCRVAVKDGKFKVLYPKLDKAVPTSEKWQSPA